MHVRLICAHFQLISICFCSVYFTVPWIFPLKVILIIVDLTLIQTFPNEPKKVEIYPNLPSSAQVVFVGIYPGLWVLRKIPFHSVNKRAQGFPYEETAKICIEFPSLCNIDASGKIKFAILRVWVITAQNY